MLSKEEIEEGKAHLCWLLDNGIFTSEDEPHIEAVLEYIEQLEQEKADRTSAESYEDSYIAKLESDKQKLIEKLEEDKETLKKENADGTLQDYVIRLLEILKGENHDNQARIYRDYK